MRLPGGKWHFLGWALITIVNTMIVLNEDKNSRMLLLVVVVVLQHITLLLFMVDYEWIRDIQWKKKEDTLKSQIETPVTI